MTASPFLAAALMSVEGVRTRAFQSMHEDAPDHSLRDEPAPTTALLTREAFRTWVSGMRKGR
jgi:hypothetical protein